jgi:hypothetical protein
MARNIQQYIDSLINKPRIYYLDLNNYTQKQEHNCSSCSQKLHSKCENCNDKNKQLLGEITDLKDFANLKGVNASNNQFTNLNFLNTLTNKLPK